MSPQDFQEADAPSMLYVNVGYIAVIVIRFSLYLPHKIHVQRCELHWRMRAVLVNICDVLC